MAKYISKFTGQEIDQRLDDVGEKFGDAYFDSATNIQYLFKSTDDKLAWLSGDASITPKVCQFEFSGTVRRMTVVNEMESKNLYYTQTSESAIITVGFKSEEKGITDTSWNEVLEDGKYYSQDGVVYQCTRNSDTAIYNKLADLIGIYVVEATTDTEEDSTGENEEVIVEYGTLENPIEYTSGITIESGKYYVQDNVIYLCNRDSGNPVYHNLSDLVGLYVEAV